MRADYSCRRSVESLQSWKLPKFPILEDFERILFPQNWGLGGVFIPGFCKGSKLMRSYMIDQSSPHNNRNPREVPCCKCKNSKNRSDSRESSGKIVSNSRNRGVGLGIGLPPGSIGGFSLTTGYIRCQIRPILPTSPVREDFLIIGGCVKELSGRSR